MQRFLPESTYSVDSTLTRQNIKKGDTITGKVVLVAKPEQFLVVNLGNFRVHMKFDEASIYTSRSIPGYVDPNIYSLVGKTIRAKVVETGENIIISRKEHMKEALDYFKAVNPTEFTVVITAFNKLSAFVDIGAGIQGRITPSDFVDVFFKNIKDIGLDIGETFTAKNLGYNDTLKSFDLSRKAAIADDPSYIQRGYYVKVKIFNSLNDGSGYIGLIDTKYPALLDSRYVTLKYGDEVIGIVKDFNSKGIKLKFVAFAQVS